MSWELLGPSLVVLFELLVFVATVAFIYYFAREPAPVDETSQPSQPATAEPGYVPPHAA